MKTLRKSLLLITLIAFVGCTDESTIEKKGAIFGAVTDFATGEQVPNANVSLLYANSDQYGVESTLTGLDGIYEFPKVEDGDYCIKVSKSGYYDVVDNYVIQVREGRRMRRDVQIESRPTSN